MRDPEVLMMCKWFKAGGGNSAWGQSSDDLKSYLTILGRWVVLVYGLKKMILNWYFKWGFFCNCDMPILGVTVHYITTVLLILLQIMESCLVIGIKQSKSVH